MTMHWNRNFKKHQMLHFVSWELHGYQHAQKAGLVLLNRAQREANIQKGHPFNQIESLLIPIWASYCHSLL